MMDSMEFSSFWEGQSLGDYTLPSSPTDAKGDLNFFDEIAHVAEAQLEKSDKVVNSLDDDDLFPEWMESKVNLTLLENLDNLVDLVDLLDDPNLVMPNEDSTKETGYPPNNTRALSFMTSLSQDPISVLPSPPYTNPNSPVGEVPNMVTPPNSPSSVTSFDLSPNVSYQKDYSLLQQPAVLVQSVQSFELADCLAATDSLPPLESVDDVESCPPSPVESLAFANGGNNTSLVILLEDSSSDDMLVPATKGRKRKSEKSEASNTKTIRLSTPSTSKAQPKTRKERKRIQNKDAATRYRQKKRQEADCIFSEEEALLEVNTQLKERVQNLSTEINYLKGLMREMFKARGILK